MGFCAYVVQVVKTTYKLFCGNHSRKDAVVNNAREDTVRNSRQQIDAVPPPIRVVMDCILSCIICRDSAIIFGRFTHMI